MALTNALVWLNQASIVSLVSNVLRDRMDAAGAAANGCWGNIMLIVLERLWPPDDVLHRVGDGSVVDGEQFGLVAP